MQKFVFTGPECSGKTTICSTIAQQVNTEWVSEYAREYLNRLERPYEESDLLEIAKGQIQKELSCLNSKSPLFCDTSLLVMKIWSTVKYGRCHPWIEEQLIANPPTLYFLCSPDIPWIADPLREHPKQRAQLLELYKEELIQLKIPFVFLSGNKQQRLAEVLKILSIYSVNAQC